MIAIVNNCFHVMELAKQMRTRYLTTGENKQITGNFESLLTTYGVRQLKQLVHQFN